MLSHNDGFANSMNSLRYGESAEDFFLWLDNMTSHWQNQVVHDKSLSQKDIPCDDADEDLFNIKERLLIEKAKNAAMKERIAELYAELAEARRARN